MKVNQVIFEVLHNENKRIMLRLTKISTREREVLNLIAYEYTTNEIAKELYLSPHTVISHRKNLLHKMDAKNVAGLVRKGYETGLLHLQLQTSF